jgi:rhamnogalacturonyl hydrolase YesR
MSFPLLSPRIAGSLLSPRVGTSFLPPRVAASLLFCLAVPLAFADGPYRNRDNPDPKDSSEGTYPVPYQRLSVAEITADLVRVRGFLETAMPARIVDRRTGQPITDLSHPVATAVMDKGEAGAFNPIGYEVGVMYAGMLSAAESTGDQRFADFTARQLQFIAESLPYFRAQAAAFGMPGNSDRPILAPDALDDCGSMTAAMIQARLAHVGPDLLPVIDGWADYIAHKQFRLPDGAFARHRPMKVSMWADDFYMGVPALAEMGKLTGDRAWFDDAVNVVKQMSAKLFRPQTGLYSHGWNANGGMDVPDFYWARANAWATLTMCDLLDVLPADHPGRAEVLRYLKTQLRAVASLQSGNGRWHQVIDRNDSYLETSASAIFVYCIAHAINQGWITPVTYGDIAQVGWSSVATQINGKGQVENTCVGTTFAGDLAYYYNRPVSVYAVHGYGPVLLAGSEMIRLLQNPAIDIQYKNRIYLYVPKSNP